MNHIIRKQIIQLVLSQRKNAFKAQHMVSRYYNDEILAVLEKVFNELSGEDEMISIDKLEIDLGLLSIVELEKPTWRNTFEQKLLEELGKILGPGKKAGAVRQRLPLTYFQQWVFYMKQGYLPWNSLSLDPAWYTNILETLATDYTSAAELRSLILADKIVLNRILAQYSPAFLTKILTILTAKNQDKLPVLIDELEVAQKILENTVWKTSEVTPKEFRKKIWREIFCLVALNLGDLSSPVISEKIIAGSFSPENIRFLVTSPPGHENLIYIKRILENIVRKSGHIPMEVKQKKQPAKTKKPPAENLKTDLKRKEDMSSPQVSTSFSVIKKTERPDRVVPPATEEELFSDHKIAIDEEGIYVSFAGIVLLHPFLANFFRINGLTTGNKFIDGDKHQKAIYLLHFLAMGQTCAEEHELFMAKVLTDYPRYTPVEKECPLSESDLNEAIHLLAAVIQHWNGLGKTSPDGLRANFLQRNGKLYMKNEQLHLLVEPASYDMLLDRLPWNISMIKLPWMNSMLNVEWR